MEILNSKYDATHIQWNHIYHYFIYEACINGKFELSLVSDFWFHPLAHPSQCIWMSIILHLKSNFIDSLYWNQFWLRLQLEKANDLCLFKKKMDVKEFSHLSVLLWTETTQNQILLNKRTCNYTLLIEILILLLIDINSHNILSSFVV